MVFGASIGQLHLSVLLLRIYDGLCEEDPTGSPRPDEVREGIFLENLMLDDLLGHLSVPLVEVFPREDLKLQLALTFNPQVKLVPHRLQVRVELILLALLLLL